jgi:uncharacterized membrane protein
VQKCLIYLFIYLCISHILVARNGYFCYNLIVALLKLNLGLVACVGSLGLPRYLLSLFLYFILQLTFECIYDAY